MQIRLLDLHFQGTSGLIGSYLIESEGEWALIETGPGSCLPQALTSLAEFGVRPEMIGKVFVTHVHLDHAGAAGWWAQQGAQVFCHPRAARHLINPSRLIESASQVYGDQMERLWGSMVSAPEARVTVLEDGDQVAFGGTIVSAWDTPGHARHHHAFVIDDVCFTGDVAGVRLENSPYLSVAAAPPQFELAAYLASVTRLREANFRRLYLTHFGEVTDVASHLQSYAERLNQVAQEAQRAIKEGLDAEEWSQRYQPFERARAREHGVGEALWNRYEQANGTAMSATGLHQWAREQEQPTRPPPN